MPLADIDHIKKVYQQIIQRALQTEGEGCTTYIFVSNDTDALCALKILTTILKSDEVQFVAIPVFSHAHLKQEIQKLQDFAYVIRNLIFLNCGGNEDLTRHWFYTSEDKNVDIFAYLMDSHRPYDHRNINDERGLLYIINDGCKSFIECPNIDDVAIYEQLNMQHDQDEDDYDEEEDSSDEEGVNDNGQEGGDLDDVADAVAHVKEAKHMEEVKQELADLKGQSSEEEMYGNINKEAQRPKLQDEEDGVVEDPAGEEQIDSVQLGVKRPRDEAGDKVFKQLDKRKLKRQKKALFMNYYRGTFYGKCSASVIYELSTQLNKDSREMLWWRIVGMTDQVLHQRMESEEQDLEFENCNKEVLRLVPNSGIEDYGAAKEQVAGGESQQDNQELDLFQKVQLQGQNREIGHIRAEPELKFMLLRFWTLFDSIQNSNYMVSKLSLWKEEGQRDLRDFFVTIGVPLEQAKQKFSFLNPEIKRTLKERIMKESEKLDLDGIIMNSYVRQFDEKTQVTATDMAYSISSLLEHPNSTREMNNNEGQENFNPNFVKGEQSATSVQSIHDCLYDNFWVAYDALDLRQNHTNLLMRGIELSKEMQKAIVRVGTSLIQKKEIKMGNSFRYCILENSFLKDVELFQYPLAVHKLALFTMQAHSASFPKAKVRPLLISVRNLSKKTTLVVAALGQNRGSETGRNSFGQKFRDVAHELKMNTIHDRFESSIIELRNEHWKKFIEELCLK